MIEKQGRRRVAVQNAFLLFPLSGDPAKSIRLTLYGEESSRALSFSCTQTDEIIQHESLNGQCSTKYCSSSWVLYDHR